jgi:hypothetical protein
MVSSSYVAFQSQNPVFDFTFCYPATWKMAETGGTGYHEIAIIGPRSQDNTFSVGLFVVVTTIPKGEGPNCALDRAVLGHSTGEKQTAVIQDGFRTVGGSDARDIELRYSILSDPNLVNAEFIPAHERILFFARENRLYEMHYLAPEAQFANHIGAFEHLVRTFEFSHSSL